MSVEKPPYRVASRAEIDEIPSNGYSVVSTFSGCGGSCLGLRMAGYRIVYASEFVPAARESYAANYPETPLDPRDIRAVEPGEILEVLAGREIDVLEGSPPCAAFSMAGKRAKSWSAVKPYSDTKQRTDDLFYEYARLLEGLRPRVFVAENVAGLVRGVAKGYYKRIFRALEAAGYVVESRLVDAQWLGVPQARLRLIFVGVRRDLAERYGVRPMFPKPLPYRYSIRDALPELLAVDGRTGPGFERVASEVDDPFNAVLVTDPAQTRYEVVAGTYACNRGDRGSPIDLDEPTPAIVAGTHGGGPSQYFVVTADGRRSLDEPSPSILTHGRLDTRSELSLAGYAIADEYDRLRPGETSERYFNLSRPDPSAPVPTVTALGGSLSAASVTHPTERRKFTIAELRRLCGFPDDFILTGTYAQQWERLGRAVPPPMMAAIAATIRDEILRRLDDGAR